MAGKEPDIGATARTVAANVKRLRGDLNYTQLSERLQEVAGWSINAVGIRRIESGERRVTPDDLVSLALAFDVSPATLLMPAIDDALAPVRTTGVEGDVDARRLWLWLIAAAPLSGAGFHALLDFVTKAVPAWMIDKDRFPVVESGTGANLTTYLRPPSLERDDGDD